MSLTFLNTPRITLPLSFLGNAAIAKMGDILQWGSTNSLDSSEGDLSPVNPIVKRIYRHNSLFSYTLLRRYLLLSLQPEGAFLTRITMAPVAVGNTDNNTSNSMPKKTSCSRRVQFIGPMTFLANAKLLSLLRLSTYSNIDTGDSHRKRRRRYPHGHQRGYTPRQHSNWTAGPPFPIPTTPFLG